MGRPTAECVSFPRGPGYDLLLAPGEATVPNIAEEGRG